MSSSESVCTICECDNCGGLLEFDSEHVGTVIECPHCQSKTILQISGQTAPPLTNAPAAPLSSLISCPDCGRDVSKRAFSCPHCGGPLQQAAHAQPPFVQYAPGLVAQPVYNLPVKSRSAYIVLGLFLGFLGLHNFYAGYIAKGVAQLLITLILGWLILPLVFMFVWVLIDLFTVTHDAYNVPMR